uniref:Syntaxin-1A-like isoform X2 n=1 Tax=Petromyzon marinus TaxID=7757 RepID=A0AAJ7WKI6_PETMA|nr:syntaxin-1A-like isoform X2 [Petromyzon marinus]
MRDRLQELRQEKQSFLAPESSDGERAGAEIPMDNLDSFLSKVNETNVELDSLGVAVQEVKRLHLAILSDVEPRESDRKQLDDVMFSITSTARRVRTQLKDLDTMLEIPDDSSTRLRMRKTTHTMASQRFVDVMKEYNSLQTEHRDLCKKRILRQMEISGQNVTAEQLDSLIESGSSSVFTQGYILESQLTRQQLGEIQSRHEELLKLEKSIQEVHDMFINIAIMVASQGDMVNNIEEHVKSASEHTEKGRTVLEQAVTHKRSARKVHTHIHLYTYSYS